VVEREHDGRAECDQVGSAGIEHRVLGAVGDPSPRRVRAVGSPGIPAEEERPPLIARPCVIGRRPCVVPHVVLTVHGHGLADHVLELRPRRPAVQAVAQADVRPEQGSGIWEDRRAVGRRRRALGAGGDDRHDETEQAELTHIQ
jgi:hypothetical protein